MNELPDVPMSKAAIKRRIPQLKREAWRRKMYLYGSGWITNGIANVAGLLVGLGGFGALAAAYAGTNEQPELSGILGVVSAVMTWVGGLGLARKARGAFAIGNEWNEHHHRLKDLGATIDGLSEEQANAYFHAYEHQSGVLRKRENQASAVVAGG